MKVKLAYCVFLLSICSCTYSTSDYTDDLGEGYLFVSESNSYQFITGPNDTSGRGIIPCTVEAFAYDEFHIIAKQKDNPDCFNEDLFEIPVAYWIIDKKEKKGYGPLDSLSFINKKNELSVSASLNLNE